MLIPPSRTDVRRYFCEVYAKWRNGDPLEPMEALLSAWMREHPEYNAVLSQPDAPVDGVPHPDHADNTNPFLHLSMHLALSEQCSIDQPKGIREAVEVLAARKDSLHDAHHATMDCLADMIATSQSLGQPPDGDSYLACVRHKATQR
ncbi:MAG: DUF1841 family protein [Brachymonas sp.]|nr:DUF1841 family protein [Brachymonas sp.]